jgi:hypothetical protein
VLKAEISNTMMECACQFMKAVGIDSVKAELGNAPNIFEGILGIAVTCKDEKTFIGRYRECMPKALEGLGIKSNRIVLKAYDLSRLAPENEDKILIPFLDCLKEEIEKIDIYYTRYNANKLPRISIYGKDQPTSKNPVEFVRIICNAYPHYVGYFYLNEYSSKDIGKIYLDHFDSCLTPAWESLSQFKGLTVVYKGGNCNCLISTSDLLVRITVTELKKKNEHFWRDGLLRIHSVFPWSPKVFVHELGGSTSILRFMTPVNRRPIDLTSYIARPLVFVPTESLAGVATNEERDLFEDLPVFDDLANFLFLTQGSFKYFKPGADIRMGKEGDYCLVVGPNSESLYQYLKKCGTKLSVISPEELKGKTK